MIWYVTWIRNKSSDEEGLSSVWPDWAIYWTLGNCLKPLATNNLHKSPTFLGNFCKGVKIYRFSSEIILGNFYRHLEICFWSHWLRLRQRKVEVAFKCFVPCQSWNKEATNLRIKLHAYLLCTGFFLSRVQVILGEKDQLTMVEAVDPLHLI